jgi:hypothetical protein
VRRTRIRNQSTKRRRQQTERRTMLATLVAERGPWCQAQLHNVCTGQAVDGHEVLPRSAGGSIVDPENVLLLCRRCHDVITQNPAWSREAGWVRSRYEGGAA